MARLSPAERNLQAEVRAVESGHRCYVDEETGACRIVSDTHHGKNYIVTFAATEHGPAVFHCEPTGPRAYEDDHMAVTFDPGVAGCFHSALSARRLARDGLIRLDEATGLWVDAGKVAPVPAASSPAAAAILAAVAKRDPFDLFNGQ